jgi:hypothetical protein
LSDLKFSHIEKTDRVPSACAMRVVLPTENVQGVRTVDQCYDFKNIFDKKSAKKLAFLTKKQS